MNKMDDIVIVGFGGHARSVADSIIREEKYNIVGYTDLVGCNCCYKYLGSDDVLKNLYEDGVHNVALGVGFMGNSYVRDSLVILLKAIGYEFPVIVDPSAIIAQDVSIGEGTFIGKNVVINAESKVGKFCIINTGVIAEHENEIRDYSHIAVGAILCGNVSIGHHSFIGANATVIQGRKIGNNCIVGANSTVLSHVENNMKACGIVSNQ